MSAKLSFNLDRKRCWEMVAAAIEESRTQAVFLRVYLTNHAGSSAKDCRVFVKSVKDHTGRLLAGERSQLVWTDQDEPGYFTGRTAESGRDRGLYIDLCSSTEGLGYLQIESQIS